MRLKRRLIKALKILVPIAALVALLVVVGFLSYFDSIAQYAMRSASSSIPGELSVKRFTPSFRGVQLEGIRWTLDGKEPFFEAEGVDVLIDHSALLRRDWLVLVEHAKIQKPGLRVIVDPQGNVNLTKLMESSGEESVDITQLRTVIEFEGGWVTLNDQRGAGFLYELTGWNGTVALPDGERMLAKTSAHPAREVDSTLAFEGEVSLIRPRVNMQINLADLDMLPFSSYPALGDFGLVMKGRVDSSMVVQGNAASWNEVLASLFAVGKVRLSEGFLSSTEFPADVEGLEGEIALLGREVSTKKFVGKVGDIPFALEGSASLEKAGSVDARVSVERFSLEKVKPYLENPPDVRGTAEAQMEVTGTITDPVITGQASGYNLRYQDQMVSKATANFLIVKSLLHFHDVVAHTSAGQVNGQGWVFLGDEIRVLVSAEGQGANPGALMPDLADSADFRVRLMGTLDKPLIYGQGRATGLGSWAQGVGSAEGKFILAGKDVMLLDGSAVKGSSQVHLPLGNFNLDSRQFDGVVATQGFDLRDAPGVSGISGQVSGNAVVSADLSGETPKVVAQGRMTDGHFAAAGYSAHSASADFSFDGYQMIVPNALATVEGGRIEAAGAFDLRNQAVELAARGDGVSLAAAGLPGESASFMGTVSGYLDGQIGVYGYADSTLGRAALSGFQRADGTLGGVAWVDGEVPGQQDSEVEAVVVAHGTTSRMNLEYTGQAQSPLLSAVGPLDVHGSALLDGSVLTVRPTVVTAASASGESLTVPFTAYSGAAYPFFGPLMSGPLTKVVVEDTSFPDSRSLTVAGQANLASRRLNLRFDLRTANLEELARQPLGSDPEAASINEALPFDVVSGFAEVTGVVSGTFGSPQVDADYSVPWLLLANGFENRQNLSSKGSVQLKPTGLGMTAAVSETPFDVRLRGSAQALHQVASREDGMMAARGKVSAAGAFDISLATAGFDARFLALLSPATYRDYLPYGRIATDNLRFWGTAGSPSLAGVIQLVGGGVFVAGQALPFETAGVRLSSANGEIRIDDLLVQASGLNVTGSGRRAANGQLSGEIVAKDVDLQQLHRFGGPLTGLTGEVDAIAALGGQFPGRPAIEIAARGRDLVWDPVAVGGLSEKIPIEEFALGQFSEDGQSLSSGLSVQVGDDGLALVLPPAGLRVRTEPGALSLEAEGAVRFPGGIPDLARFKTFKDWARFFVSPKGPDFGVAQETFRVKLDNWSFAQTARLLGRSALAESYRATASGDVALSGQWWRDHARTAGGTLPDYRFSMSQASFQGKSEELFSGFELAEATQLFYRREGVAGFLGLENFRLDFLSEVAPANPAEADAEPVELEVSRRGSLEAEAKLALTQLPETQPVSTLNLGAVDIPLENLAFMLPNVVNLSGLLESVEVNMTGILPRPDLSVTGLITNLAVGPLQNMTLRGSLTGDQDESGDYLLSLGDENNPSVTLNFGTTDSKVHQLTASGTANLLWRRENPLDPARLSLFSEGLEVSPDSPIDLAAEVYDRNLQILADALPGKDVAKGDLTALLSVNGTLGYPQFEGHAKLADGQFLSQNYGRFEGLQLDATVERISPDEATPSEVSAAQEDGLITRFMLPRFEGTLGKKEFRAGGIAEFAGIAPTFLNMFFKGEALPVQMPDLFVGTADVDLELRGRVENDEQGGTKLKPVVLGTLDIPQGDFSLPLGSVTGGSAEGEGFRLPFEYDLSLNLGQEFYVRALDSQVRAVGQLRLLSDAGKPQMYGTVDLTRGLVRIPFYDASFRIRQGLAHFDGPMIPRLESVEAVADLSGYRVSARVEGRYPDTLSVSLLSDPPLPQAELSRMVVLGGLPSALTGVNDPNQSGSSAGVLSGQGVSMLSGILTNRLTEQLGRMLFLSEVSFDYIPPAQYVIKLAKALDPNDTFLLTLTRVVRDNGINESLYGIEWRLTRTFLTRVALDQFARARFWVQSINRF